MYEVDREAEIIKYLPLVERVVQRLSIKTADYESGDLYNIGVIGLMDAAPGITAGQPLFEP